jgi:hypothetical protein
MGNVSDYHILIRQGDASAEIEQLLREAGPNEPTGLRRYYYVSRANQTIVMTTDANAPIARRLREREGWREPGLSE